MMSWYGNAFRINGPFWREYPADYDICCLHEQTVEQSGGLLFETQWCHLYETMGKL